MKRNSLPFSAPISALALAIVAGLALAVSSNDGLPHPGFFN